MVSARANAAAPTKMVRIMQVDFADSNNESLIFTIRLLKVGKIKWWVGLIIAFVIIWFQVHYYKKYKKDMIDFCKKEGIDLEWVE